MSPGWVILRIPLHEEFRYILALECSNRSHFRLGVKILRASTGIVPSISWRLFSQLSPLPLSLANPPPSTWQKAYFFEACGAPDPTSRRGAAAVPPRFSHAPLQRDHFGEVDMLGPSGSSIALVSGEQRPCSLGLCPNERWSHHSKRRTSWK